MPRTSRSCRRRSRPMSGARSAQAQKTDRVGELEQRAQGTLPNRTGKSREGTGEHTGVFGSAEHSLAKPDVPVASREHRRPTLRAARHRGGSCRGADRRRAGSLAGEIRISEAARWRASSRPHSRRREDHDGVARPLAARSIPRRRDRGSRPRRRGQTPAVSRRRRQAHLPSCRNPKLAGGCHGCSLQGVCQ